MGIANLIENDDFLENEQNEAKMFLFKKQEVIETNEEVKERLENLGVHRIELEGLQEKFQKEIVDSMENMLEKYPELDGYITSIKSVHMHENALACSGPRFSEKGYEGAELQFNKDFFGKKNYGLKIVDCESDLNWKGERWLAGQGPEAIVDHEIGHVMALRLNAQNVGIEIGDYDKEKFKQLQSEYDHNFIINKLCYDTLKELEISPKDVGKELSTYGSRGFGEAFAECVSEVETKKRPRVYAQTVVANYQKLVDEKKEVF